MRIFTIVIRMGAGSRGSHAKKGDRLLKPREIGAFGMKG
jgi:hypothetical protein